MPETADPGRSRGVLLALDTSTYHAGVGVLAGGRTLEKTWHSRNNHGAELLAAAAELLQQAGLALTQVERVAVATGPGGFSALRVGIATTKGLAMPRGLPLVGVSTFDIEAARWWPQPRPLVSVVAAGAAGLAWALYDSPGTGPLPGPTSRRSFGVVAANALPGIVPGDAVFCGEGVEGLSGLVEPARILGGTGQPRRPSDLIRLAAAGFAAGHVDDPAGLVPFYARQPSITRPRGSGATAEGRT